MSFDWRTETDEDDWEKELTPSVAAEAAPPRKWGRWLAAGLALLLIGVIAGLLVRRAEQQVEMATTAVERDVLTTHELIQQTALRDDRELFLSLLSASDPAWRAIQEELFRRQALASRPVLGLVAVLPPGDNITVTIAPDLKAAEVSTTHIFSITTPHGPAQTARLRQVSVYQQAATGWLLAPPTAEFWGRPIVNRGPYLTLTYPERDELVGGRLAADLEQIINQLCAPAVELACPAGLQIELQLETSPLYLLRLTDQSEANAVAMKLPAPSLVGVPVDEAGYQALRRAYGTLLATRLIEQLGGQPCCGQAELAEVLLARQLYLLDLQPWPLRPADYQTIWQNPTSLYQLGSAWEGAATDWRLSYALVDFLTYLAPEISPVRLRRELEMTASYQEWLRLFVWTERLSDPQLEQEWLNLHFERLAAAATPSPIALPNQDLLLTCTQQPGNIFDLYHYDLAGHWVQEIPERDFYALYGLPDNSGVLVMDQVAGLGGPLISRVSLWRDGRQQTVYSGPTFYYYDEQADPTGQKLALLGVDSSQGETFAALLDLATCRAGDCELQPMDGFPLWSPDGRQTILTDNNQPGLSGNGQQLFYRGDERGYLRSSVAVGTGISPFWLDNESYGYVRSVSEPAVVRANFEDFTANVFLSRETLKAAIPTEAPVNALQIIEAVVSPADSDLLFLRVRERSQDFVLSYRMSTAELTYRFTTGPLVEQFSNDADDVNLGSLSFSPDGRWLTLSATGPNRPGIAPLWQQYLYDLESGSLRTLSFDPFFVFPEQQWSADSQWLVRLGSGFLHLSAPAYNYQQVIELPFFDCTNVVWVNR